MLGELRLKTALTKLLSIDNLRIDLEALGAKGCQFSNFLSRVIRHGKYGMFELLLEECVSGSQEFNPFCLFPV